MGRGFTVFPRRIFDGSFPAWYNDSMAVDKTLFPYGRTVRIKDSVIEADWPHPISFGVVVGYTDPPDEAIRVHIPGIVPLLEFDPEDLIPGSNTTVWVPIGHRVITVPVKEE